MRYKKSTIDTDIDKIGLFALDTNDHFERDGRTSLLLSPALGRRKTLVSPLVPCKSAAHSAGLARLPSANSVSNMAAGAGKVERFGGGTGSFICMATESYAAKTNQR